MNMEKPAQIPIFLSRQMDFKYIDPMMVIVDYFRRPELVKENLIKFATLPYLKRAIPLPRQRGCRWNISSPTLAPCGLPR